MNEKFRKKSRKNTENEMLFRRSKKGKNLFRYRVCDYGGVRFHPAVFAVFPFHKFA